MADLIKIVDRLAVRLGAVGGEPLPLDGGITNRNFRVPAPCHDDLLPGNVLAADADPGRAVLVDWEYAGMGHRYFDLANLAVNNEFDEAARERLLTAYFDRAPGPGQHATLRLMMLVSDAREAAWGVVQGSISELDFDFADYARRHFTRLERNASDPRLQEWLDAAAP